MDTQNHFQFDTSSHLEGVTVLSANMSDFSYDKHAHEEYSIGVTLKGRQDFFCCRAFHKSPPGGVILFNPEDVHDGHSGAESDLEYVMLYLHPDALGSQFKALGVKAEQTLRVEGILLNSNTLRNQVLRLSGLIQQPKSTKIEQESALFQISHSLVAISGKLDELPSTTRKDARLLRAKDYIQSRLENDISIDDIASAASMSKYHFIRLFRAQFGITPHQYVINCRINVARKTLETGMPASEVAQYTGFADGSHLNRQFKRFYGMTPKQYQKQTSP